MTKSFRLYQAKPIKCIAEKKQDSAGHRRRDTFAALRVIGELLPRAADVAGKTAGTLGIKQVAIAAGIGNKASARAFRFLRDYRVLWLWWRGHGFWEVRFERAVVDKFLAIWEATPRENHKALMAHRLEREALSPWSKVRKTAAVGQPQSVVQ